MGKEAVSFFEHGQLAVVYYLRALTARHDGWTEVWARSSVQEEGRDLQYSSLPLDKQPNICIIKLIQTSNLSQGTFVAGFLHFELNSRGRIKQHLWCLFFSQHATKVIICDGCSSCSDCMFAAAGICMHVCRIGPSDYCYIVWLHARKLTSVFH